MKQAKAQTESIEISYSANDLRLKRFIELGEQIKVLTLEHDSLKEEIKHRGTHSTQHFVATVSDVERTQPPALKVLVEKFGEGVRALCTKITYQTVKVSEKAD